MGGLLAALPPAQAQVTERYREGSSYAGTARRGPGGTVDRYDGQGRYAGGSNRWPDGSVDHYDAGGRYTGSPRR